MGTKECSSCGHDLMLLLGRMCLSLMFIIAGISKITAYDANVVMMVAEGIPYAGMILVGVIIMELGGGLMVFFGLKARFGAFMLFLFIIPVTFFFHDFWDFSDTARTFQVYHFLKNLCIMGGMLYIMAAGPGKYSFDRG